MTDRRCLEELLRAADGDVGCAASAEVLDVYVDLELAGEDPARAYPGAAVHLRSCPACRTEYEGLLAAVCRFAEIRRE